jgi:hypothetical protein
MNNSNEKIKEERALEALLAAAFRLDFPEEIPDKEIEAFFQKPIQLSQEDKDAVDSWGTDFVEKLAMGHKTNSHILHEETRINQELELEISAMARDKDGNDVDEETRRKIDEERRKALEEEEKDNNKNDS